MRISIFNQFYAIVLTMVLVLPFLHTSISLILNVEDKYELAERSQEEERSDERDSEEETETDIEEFIVNHLDKMECGSDINYMRYYLSRKIDLVYQEYPTPPPEFLG